MYPEFIAIYIGIAVIIALGITILILLTKLLKNSNDLPMPKPNIAPTLKTQPNISNASNQENGNMLLTHGLLLSAFWRLLYY